MRKLLKSLWVFIRDFNKFKNPGWYQKIDNQADGGCGFFYWDTFLRISEDSIVDSITIEMVMNYEIRKHDKKRYEITFDKTSLFHAGGRYVEKSKLLRRLFLHFEKIQDKELIEKLNGILNTEIEKEEFERSEEIRMSKEDVVKLRGLILKDYK